MREAALIVGGGPAGAAAGIALAGAGARPLLLERTRDPADAICGGFLSWRTLAALEALGVAGEALNPEPIGRVRLFAGARRLDAALPAPARAVSRRRLDALLLARAAAAGVRVERGAHVRAVEGRSARLADGTDLAADALFLASGKHEVRGAARAAPLARDPTIGLRIRLGPAPGLARAVAGAIELHLFDRGYAGLVLQEDGTGNLALAVRRSRLAAAGGPDALLAALADEAPALGDRLAYAHGPADAVANVPYGWRATTTAAGVFRLGDQAAVIPSLAGEGMGLAIASGLRAAAAWAGGGAAAAPAYQRAFARAAARPVGLARAAWACAERPALARALVTLAPASLIDVIARATRVPHGDAAALA